MLNKLKIIDENKIDLEIANDNSPMQIVKTSWRNKIFLLKIM